MSIFASLGAKSSEIGGAEVVPSTMHILCQIRHIMILCTKALASIGRFQVDAVLFLKPVSFSSELLP